MAAYRNTHPTRPGAVAQRPLPGHHGRRPASATGHYAKAAGSKPTSHPPLGKSATELAAASKASEAKYAWAGTFDPVKLRVAFLKEFSKVRNFDPEVIPHMELLVGFMAKDPAITDIRWMAYMLATAYKETTDYKREAVPRLGKNRKPLHDKHGKPLVRTLHRWLVAMAPIREVGRGKGKPYYLPVKVESLPNGEARVTEEDGDQFMVSAQGRTKPLTKDAVQGTSPTQKATKAYTDIKVEPLTYYGRGYVQLTWWNNYVKSGVELGLGLQLLLDPDRVLEPKLAYCLMAHGMRTGKGFAGGHKFADYFNGNKTDYVHARHMVNRMDHAVEIADVAEKFDTVLLAAES